MSLPLCPAPLSLESPPCGFQDRHDQPPEVPALRGKRRAGPSSLPSPLGATGQAAWVPGRCLPHRLRAPALATDVCPFIAVPSLGAQRFAEASSVLVTGCVRMVLMPVFEALCVVSWTQKCFPTCLWLRELPDSRKKLLSGSVGHSDAPAQMMLRTRCRKSLS